MNDKNDNEIVTRGDRERASNRLWRLIFWVFIVVLAIGYMVLNPEAVGGVRYDQDLVERGDSMDSVFEACGEPKRRARLVDDDGDTIGTVLYIDPGRSKHTRRLEGRSGRVSLIEQID